MRAAAMLRALAGAGHRVDLVAPRTDLPDHPRIRMLAGGGEKPIHRAKLRMECLHAMGHVSYDAVHAVDDAVFFAARLCRWKKIPLAYDAARCFTGKAGLGTSSPWRFFPKHFQRMEAKVLDRADIVFSPCSALTADLHGMDKCAAVVQLEDVPVQPLHAQQDTGKSTLSESLGQRPAAVVVCSLLPGHAVDFRKLLLAARKVVDAMPEAIFFFNGERCEQAVKMAASLDIADHCHFLSPDEHESFLSALEIADAVLWVPSGESRYIDPQVYTLLHAAAPLVTIHDAAYDEVLTEKTSMRILPSSEAIAEGLLRAIKEPLFSLAVAVEGQQLVASNHTYSSFKHKVRMAYHPLSGKE